MPESEQNIRTKDFPHPPRSNERGDLPRKREREASAPYLPMIRDELGSCAAPASVASIRIDLIEHADDLERDQHDDNEFEAQRSAGVDDVGERVGGFRDHGQFWGGGI